MVTTRQPIVSVLGHVDHGKTSLLDKIRGSGVAGRESGGITQHIGASEMPLEAIRDVCGPLMKGKEFRVPGLLFIDTPGHHAFTTLRARGGALADIAVLVVDIQEGFRPQTKEALQILRRNRTPFVVAANKLDRIHGWESAPDEPFLLNVKKQGEGVLSTLDDRVYTIIGQLTDNGVPSADRIDRITDFTKSVAVVPVSALTGEGIPDLLLTLVGLAQRFLEEALKTDLDKPGRGTVLEVKEERGVGLTLDAILYDGNIRAGDTIVLGALGKPKVTKVKGLLRPKPRDEMRDHREPFSHQKEVTAAAGIKISAQDLEGVLPGTPLVVVREKEGSDLEAIVAEIAAEVKIDIPTEDVGVFVKADTLGSLEAIAFELKAKQIPIQRAVVGDVSRRDVTDAAAIQDATRRVILAFSVKLLPDAKDVLNAPDAPVVAFQSDIIYDLIDRYEEWVEKRIVELEADRRVEMTFPGRVLLMPDHVFRVSKPAIVGLRILAGRLRVGQRFLLEDGRVQGEVKSIRRGEQSVAEALPGEEVAVAIDDVTIGRQMSPGDQLLVDVPEGDFKKLYRSDLVNVDERDVMDSVARIKRRQDRFWGA
ncbi:MAG TPA: translation initiation factor IF-2 [Candidatus Thermoplasmatota archaeon]|nr:translation initiation factor IF-2 [Candidatus Thermoplasmatota archaeon]